MGFGNRLPRFYLAVILAHAVLVSGMPGCQRRENRKQTKQPLFEELGKLPGLSHTHSAELKAELARLTAENATPELLDQTELGTSSDRGVTGSNSGSPSNSSHKSKSRDLVPSVFSKRESEEALQKLGSFYPAEDLAFTPTDYRDAIQLRNQLTPQLARYRTMLWHPKFRFHVSAVLGISTDLSFVDEARLAHRLEAVNAAESLRDGYPNSAVLPLRNMLHIDSHLSVVRHVVPRFNAATLRNEALRVLAAISAHPAADHDLRCQLLQLIHDSLIDWPSDANTWIGDRAFGMHMYELVRHGEILSLLNPREYGTLKQQGNMDSFANQVARNVEADELFYLKTMREVIDRCQSPYYERQDIASQITERLDELQETDQYPTFAAQFLLDDLEKGLRLQALDRARCEAWRLALALATRNPLPASRINPLTGKPYHVVQTSDQVIIDAIDGIQGQESISVPLTLPDVSDQDTKTAADTQ